MKIKVTHEDKSVILDIPADKVMVVLADVYSYKTEEVKDCIDTVSFIKDCGDIVEIKCSEDGDAAHVPASQKIGTTMPTTCSARTRPLSA